MNVTVGELWRIDFDDMENDVVAAVRRRRVAVFAGAAGGAPPRARAAEWLSRQPPHRVRLAWDGGIYPRWEYVEAVAQ